MHERATTEHRPRPLRTTVSSGRSSVGSWVLDPSTGAVDWSPEMYEIYGLGREVELTAEAIASWVHPSERRMVMAAYRAALESQTPFLAEFRIVTPAGTERAVVSRAAFVGDGDGARLIGTLEAIPAAPDDHNELVRLANHDPLTGLPNRRWFMEELEREVAEAAATESPGAVLMVDLDGFKDVNDSLGHAAGDKLLVRIGSILRGRTRANDSLARLGGDEFALILPGCPAADAERVAADLLGALGDDRGIVLAGRPRRLHASIGIAIFSGERTAAQVLVEADMAMYRGKRNGGGAAELFDEQMRAEVEARVRTESELRGALDEGQLEIYYQPLVAVEDQGIVSCEALVRWNHPERGLVGPGDFIPHAEASGMINPLGAWVLENACMQSETWRRQGANAGIAVNVSPRQLVEQDVGAVIESALSRSGLPAAALTIEITETSLLDGPGRIAPILAEIRSLGVRVAIDDFGRGSSSLGFLRMLPVDVVKIDRLFISGLPDSDADRAIVSAVLSLAEEMDVTVVAEGVETERQHWELRELGCPLAQGFLYSRPVPAGELDLSGFSGRVTPGLGDPSVIREFMRQIGIPARIEA